jgi:hypothetical protein
MTVQVIAKMSKLFTYLLHRICPYNSQLKVQFNGLLKFASTFNIKVEKLKVEICLINFRELIKYSICIILSLVKRKKEKI